MTDAGMTDDTNSNDSAANGENGSKAAGGGNHTLYMVASIILAFVVAWLAPHFAASLEVGGEIFLRLLTMVVVPLVMASVMSGILGLGDVRKLGKPGAAAVGYYLMTTVLAVTIGVIVVNVFQPGVGVNAGEMLAAAESIDDAVSEIAESNEHPKGISGIFRGLLLMLFTDNLLGSMVNTQLLPLIVFSIVFAGMLTTMGERAQLLSTLVTGINDALLSFVMLLMKFAPLGIFCLVTSKFGEAFAQGTFVEQLNQLFWYVVTVLTGLGIHALVVLPFILWFFTRRNPYEFIRQMSDALLTAFSTASSSATLPVTMECAEKKAGVSKRSTEFVLPLGATINMDGTALYEAAAAIFIAQIHSATHPEFAFGLTEQIVIAVTATLAAIGAAGIPEAGLVTMLIVLNAVGLPVHYLPLILPVDWFLDRFRTATNAFGDSVGSAVVDQTFPKDGSVPA
jgi:solute carrier family 1 (neuronal/epithelial high affinity glutamate transporter), member 1